MQTFSEFARACGVLVGDLYPSDRIRRCATTAHERSKNGAYFWDGQRGWVKAWDGDGEVHWYGGEFKPLTEEEKRTWARKRDAERQRRLAKQAQAAREAEELIRSCQTTDHGYLHRKGFPEMRGLVTPDDTLLIPMRDVITNRLLGVQKISWDADARRWVKRMAAGMRATGAVMRLGPLRTTETILCEGYATGLSIEAAARQMRLSAAVMVCFSDSNMVHVASQLKGLRYCFADHDDIPKPEREKRDRGEPFEHRGPGELAAIDTGLAYCMSDVLGEDANDLHVRAGILPVAMKLMTARRAAMGR